MADLDTQHVLYQGRRWSTSVGQDLPVAVNLSVGVAKPSKQAYETEVDKIERILNHARPPDLMMDLSTTRSAGELWPLLVERFGGPVGTVPHYIASEGNRILSPSRLLHHIEQLVQGGIGFLTIHASPTKRLIELASSRLVPQTSRGGGIIIRSMLEGRRSKSVYRDILPELASLAAEHSVVINFGTAFRSANTTDGFDDVAREELVEHEGLIALAKSAGAAVALEGPGHLRLEEIEEYVRHATRYRVPLMPLGPIPSDAFPGIDHITNAIGAAYMMSKVKGGIINAVTRVEHLGGVPTVAHLLEALDAAHVAAHTATISYRPEARTVDRDYAVARADNQTCVVPSLLSADEVIVAPGCSRCGDLCPLLHQRGSYR